MYCGYMNDESISMIWTGLVCQFECSTWWDCTTTDQQYSKDTLSKQLYLLISVSELMHMQFWYGQSRFRLLLHISISLFLQYVYKTVFRYPDYLSSDDEICWEKVWWGIEIDVKWFVWACQVLNTCYRSIPHTVMSDTSCVNL